jgi:hypothetical protein
MSDFSSPEQLQQRLREFLKSGFAPMPAESVPDEPVAAAEAGTDSDPVRDFCLTPKEIKAHLDRFLILPLP